MVTFFALEWLFMVVYWSFDWFIAAWSHLINAKYTIGVNFLNNKNYCPSRDIFFYPMASETIVLQHARMTSIFFIRKPREKELTTSLTFVLFCTYAAVNHRNVLDCGPSK